MKKYIYPFITLILFSLLLTSCSDDSSVKPVRRTQFIMGTLVEITVAHPDTNVVHFAASKAFDEMKRVEAMMSTYLPDSEVSKINNAAGKEAVSVSPELLKVIEEGIRWGEKSEGLFDITIHPLVELWDFDGEGKSVPNPEALEEALGLVNFRDVRITGNKVLLTREDMAMNLGGIAKGYAVDRAIDILRGLVPNGIINAGGDLYAFGQREPDHPWVIGLQHPRKPQEVLASFALQNRGVATSGDYQRYFMEKGKRFHHILNPETGMPSEGPISVTVVADSVMEADALSTAVFVMGEERGLDWIESLEQAEAMLIVEDGSARFSSNFKKLPQFNLRKF